MPALATIGETDADYGDRCRLMDQEGDKCNKKNL